MHIFFFLMLSAFIYGARKGYRQWKLQQSVVVQRNQGWRN